MKAFKVFMVLILEEHAGACNAKRSSETAAKIEKKGPKDGDIFCSV